MPKGNNLSGAARSSFEESTSGKNSGSKPNASRDVAKPDAKRPATLTARTNEQLGRTAKTYSAPKGPVSGKTARQLGQPNYMKQGYVRSDPGK